MIQKTALGKIYEIKVVEKGYKRLTMTVNVPFETKVLKFNVWDEHRLLKDTLEPFKEGEDVAVEYHNQGSFLRLDKLKPAMIDSCPICYNNLEAIDAQRLDCTACSIIPQDEQKTRVNCRMRLMSKNMQQYMYSKGFRIQLMLEEEDKTFTTVIFENNLLFPSVANLITDQNYFVVAWRSKRDLLDIIDIY